MPEIPTDAALYDLVCSTLIGAKYLLERLQQRHAQARGLTETDAADVTAMIQHLAVAATAFHALYMTQPTSGGQQAGHP